MTQITTEQMQAFLNKMSMERVGFSLMIKMPTAECLAGSPSSGSRLQPPADAVPGSQQEMAQGNWVLATHMDDLGSVPGSHLPGPALEGIWGMNQKLGVLFHSLSFSLPPSNKYILFLNTHKILWTFPVLFYPNKFPCLALIRKCTSIFSGFLEKLFV